MTCKELKDDVTKMNVVGVLTELDNAINAINNAKLWYTLGDIDCVTDELDNLIKQIKLQADYFRDFMLFI